jgi:hypothetical protein
MKASPGMPEQGLKRRPLLQTSSPLKLKINRGLTLELVQQTGAPHYQLTRNAIYSPPARLAQRFESAGDRVEAAVIPAKGCAVMACKACGSDRLKTFNGEVAIHLPGLEGSNDPIVWVFPKVLVCLNCRGVEFAIPDAERSVLANERSRGAA